MHETIRSDYIKALLPGGLPVKLNNTSAISAITNTKKNSFYMLSKSLKHSVPCSTFGYCEFELDDYHTLGRMLLHSLVRGYKWPGLNPILTATLVCSDIDKPTTTLIDAEVMECAALYDEAAMYHMNIFINSPIDETMDLSFLNQGDNIDALSREKRLKLVCNYYRRELLEERMESLITIRDGFRSIKNMTPAINLFTTLQLYNTLVVIEDITYEKLLQKMNITGSAADIQIFSSAVSLFTPYLIQQFIRFVTNCPYLDSTIFVTIMNMDVNIAYQCSSCHNSLTISTVLCVSWVPKHYSKVWRHYLQSVETFLSHIKVIEYGRA